MIMRYVTELVAGIIIMLVMMYRDKALCRETGRQKSSKKG